jgi:hypothetical protein
VTFVLELPSASSFSNLDPMAEDRVSAIWASHHAGLGALNDSLASTDRLVHASVRRKNDQLARLQEELRGLRARAIEREARARQTLERALHEQQLKCLGPSTQQNHRGCLARKGLFTRFV